MRILLINYEYPPVGGGASNATWEIARAMVKLGHEPVVLTARYKYREPDTSNPGIKVIEVPAIRHRKDRCSIFEMTTFVASATLRIRNILRRERIEGMIAFFSIPCGPIAWWGWRGTKNPYVVSLRGGDVPGMEPRLTLAHALLLPLRRVVLRRARAVCTNAPALQRAAERADKVRVHVIANGVDTTFWQPGPNRTAPPFKLLFVGRLHRQKRVGWLLRRLAGLRQEHPDLEWTLAIVGDGPDRLELESEARALGLTDHVTWHGWLGRESLRASYQTSDLLLNCSVYEGDANTIKEALACGVPVAVMDPAPLGDVFVEGVTGFKLSENNESILRFLGGQKPCAAPDVIRERLGRCGSWATTAGSLLTALAGEPCKNPACTAPGRVSSKPVPVQERQASPRRNTMPDSAKPITQHFDEIQSNRRSWASKPLLHRIYAAFYEQIAARLPAPALGPVLELGSGIGHAKTHIPGCITSDLFPNPGIDRVENAYRINFPDASLGALILIDVWHHLQFPATAAHEFCRILKPGGRLILLEPAAGLLGRCIYGLFHHEPLALRHPITWWAPTSFDPHRQKYYAAQGNAWRMFSRQRLPDQLAGWRLHDLQLMSALTYVASGGLSKAQLYPASLYPALLSIERLLNRAPRLFSTRMLVCLEKNESNLVNPNA